MDNIIIKKTWSDQDFFQIEIWFVSDMVSCKTVTYTTTEEITSLSNKIFSCTNKDGEGFEWRIGEKGSEHSPMIAISASHVDIHGRVLLNVECDVLSAACAANYFCSFPVVAELGLLRSFGERIVSINHSGVGTVISML